MKTAQEWSEELPLVNSESWRCGALINAVSLESIRQIQLDAYKQGQEDTMKRVGEECARITKQAGWPRTRLNA
jgi:hypothetical protein